MFLKLDDNVSLGTELYIACLFAFGALIIRDMKWTLVLDQKIGSYNKKVI